MAKKSPKPESACMSCGSKTLVLHGPEANAEAMLAALKQVSFYSRINHVSPSDYGDLVNGVLKKMGVPTGVLVLLVSLSGCGGVLVRADEGEAAWRAAFERCQAQAAKESAGDRSAENAFIVAFQSCMSADGWRYARAR